jgi:predicted HTH transcriptional regulator
LWLFLILVPALGVIILIILIVLLAVGPTPGSNRIDIFDRVEFESYLPRAVAAVEDFVKKHAYLSAEFGHGVRRRDVWSVSLGVIRELVVNAIAHASYSEIGTPIRVAFFDDRIEVESPGGLLPGVTPETMLAGVSEIRNPAITRVLHEMGLMEQWGSGFPGVVRELAERGLPAPEVQELPASVRVSVPIPNHMPRIAPTPGTTRSAREPDADEPRGASHKQDVKQDVSMSEQDVPVLSAAQIVMLRRARDGDASRADLLKAASLADDYRSYRRHIVPLIEAGLLVWTIPDRPRARTQRYAITDDGHQLLSNLEESALRRSAKGADTVVGRPVSSST